MQSIWISVTTMGNTVYGAAYSTKWFIISMFIPLKRRLLYSLTATGYLEYLILRKYFSHIHFLSYTRTQSLSQLSTDCIISYFSCHKFWHTFYLLRHPCQNKPRLNLQCPLNWIKVENSNNLKYDIICNVII